jgi:hypothetical protein
LKLTHDDNLFREHRKGIAIAGCLLGADLKTQVVDVHKPGTSCQTPSYALSVPVGADIGETKDIISSLFFDSTDPATEPFKRPQNYDLYTVSDRTVNISKKGNSANGWRNLIFQVENNWRLPHSNDYSTKDIGFKLCIVINSKYELGDDNI